MESNNPAGNPPPAEAVVPVPRKNEDDSKELEMLKKIRDEIAEQNESAKKHRKLLKFCMIFLAIIALVAIIFAICVIPPLVTTLNNIDVAIKGANELIQSLDPQQLNAMITSVNETLVKVQETITYINTIDFKAINEVIANINNVDFESINKSLQGIAVIDFNSINEAIDTLNTKVSSLNIESLNVAIEALGQSISNLSTFINNIKFW